MTPTPERVRIKVSPVVARFVKPDAPLALKLQAARGEANLEGRDLLTALLFLGHSKETQVREQALATFRSLSRETLLPAAADPEAPPQILDLIARQHTEDSLLMRVILENPTTPDSTLLYLAASGRGAVLARLAEQRERLEANPEILAVLLKNPQCGTELKHRIDVPPASAEEEAEESAVTTGEDAEDENQSKYQLSLEMGVSEKIKMALTGDKEWRTIFLKDPNKLVSSAALKNPRITEGEVLTLAKNRSTGDELIRMINLNREWVKNYEIRKALVMHPRTPLPKALRYMNTMGEKEIKDLAKSRGVSQVIVNNARRILMAKEKKS